MRPKGSKNKPKAPVTNKPYLVEEQKIVLPTKEEALEEIRKETPTETTA
jgi:hypothetical protein